MEYEYTNFQKRTIRRVVESFTNKGVNRMLVADEVGLGKTIVAKGVINCLAYRKYRDMVETNINEKVYRFDVLYLCSNMNIAAQNEEKLGFNSSGKKKPKENRLTMVFKQYLDQEPIKYSVKDIENVYLNIFPEEKGKSDAKFFYGKEIQIHVIPITPKTSIKIDGKGWKEEREFIIKIWKDTLEYKKDENRDEWEEFKEKPDAERMYKILSLKSDRLQQKNLSEMIQSPDEYKEEWEEYRKIIAESTLEWLKYDLVILDEFQNFQDIIQQDTRIRQEEEKYKKSMELIYNILKSRENKQKGDIYGLVIKYLERVYQFSDKQNNKEYLDEKLEQLITESQNKFYDNLNVKKIYQIFNEILKEYLRNQSCDKIKEVDLTDRIRGVWVGKEEYIRKIGEYILGKGSGDIEWINAILTGEIAEIESSDMNSKEDVKKFLKGFKICEFKDETKVDCVFGLMIYAKCKKYKKIAKDFIIEYEQGNSENSRKSIKEKIEKLWEIMEQLKEENINVESISGEWLDKYSDYFVNDDKNDIRDNEDRILNNIFEQEKTVEGSKKILMLSATPFRMYPNREDKAEMKKEEGNIDIICNFLDKSGALRNCLKEYKTELEKHIYKKDDSKFDSIIEKKREFEKKMNNYFSRMERNTVIKELCKKNNGLVVVKSEEKACGSILELVDYVKEITEYAGEGNGAIRYAKNIPYLFSFMKKLDKKKSEENEDYQLKKKFDTKVKKGISYKEGSKCFINRKDIEKKEKSMGEWHGIYKEILKYVLDLEQLEKTGMIEKEDIKNHPGAARMLWVPPTITVEGDNLGGPFREHEDFGKTIIFSNLIAIPKMFSILTSYEVERRLLWWIECKNEEISKENIMKMAEILKEKKEKIKSRLAKKSYIRDACEHTFSEINPNGKLNEELEDTIKKLVGKIFFANHPIGLYAVWATEGYKFREEDDEDIIIKCCRDIDSYCKKGCLESVLKEWSYLFKEEEDSFETMRQNFELEFCKKSDIQVEFYKEEDGKLAIDKSKNDDKMPQHYAKCVSSDNSDKDFSSIRKAFNSPFAPFVFSTTSIGQEGLDFHCYADRIVHWNLPANPVDMEQREGRINRYNCLAIRKKLIKWYGKKVQNNIHEMFENAVQEANIKLETEQDKADDLKHCGMIPNWILLKKDSSAQEIELASIKRVIPYFYTSEELEKYNKAVKVLQLYRTVMGQANPDEAMEKLIEEKRISGDQNNMLQELSVDFSPYNN